MSINEDNDRDPISRMEEAQKRYFESEKGKSALKRFQKSNKGRDVRKRYLESEKGQMALLRYYLSDKAIANREKKKDTYRLMSLCSKYLEENPDKTPTDFLNSLKGYNNEET